MCVCADKRQLHSLEEEVRDLRDTQQVMLELLQSSRELKEQVKDIKAAQEVIQATSWTPPSVRLSTPVSFARTPVRRAAHL